MNSTRSRIVRLLIRQGPLKADDISAALDLDSISVHQEIRRLLAAGIAREDTPEDGPGELLYSVVMEQVDHHRLALLHSLGLTAPSNAPVQTS